ncbi:hypothetical protein BTUL_0380g00030 [Botrytis tulipae]|uniref:Uncharacterized protein n=1 Tax=Botrytis tulipae TaxID=87230 RepID=A0A4Z1E6G7_9HELO|nr:hypothetical protein BTUL_0380g00030 [Botrytis tulipae]
MRAILSFAITISPALYRPTRDFNPVVDDILQNDVAAFLIRYGSHFVAGCVEQSRIRKGFGTVDTTASIISFASDKIFSSEDIERTFKNFPTTRLKLLTPISHTHAFNASQYEDL